MAPRDQARQLTRNGIFTRRCATTGTAASARGSRAARSKLAAVLAPAAAGFPGQPSGGIERADKYSQGGRRGPLSNGTVDVSVLTPVLNEADHIRETVAAMRAQRFDGEVEFLFMDGGSEDATRAILEELAREDPRIRVFDNPGRQVTHGLNVGLRNARGEFVARMDAHTYYPRRVSRAGRRAAAARRRRVGRRPADPARNREVVAPGGARAGLLARPGRLAQVGRRAARPSSTRASSAASGGGRRSSATGAGTRAGT